MVLSLPFQLVFLGQTITTIALLCYQKLATWDGCYEFWGINLHTSFSKVDHFITTNNFSVGALK
jgi:hypothetical protein